MKLIPLQLNGDGYSVSLTKDAKAKKSALISEAIQISEVSDNEQAEEARYCLKELNDFSILLERCRKEVKEPVLEAGRRIDAAAKDFIKDVDVQKFRITNLISDHAREQQIKQQEALRKQQEAEMELQRKAMEEERKRLEAERAALAAEHAILDADTKKQRAAAQKLAEEARAREAEAEKARLAAEAAEQKEDAAAMVVLEASAPKGVKPTLDYEVTDIHLLYRNHPELVELTPKRSLILAELKNLQDDNLPVSITGLKVIEKFKISSR